MSSGVVSSSKPGVPSAFLPSRSTSIRTVFIVPVLVCFTFTRNPPLTAAKGRSAKLWLFGSLSASVRSPSAIFSVPWALAGLVTFAPVECSLLIWKMICDARSSNSPMILSAVAPRDSSRPPTLPDATGRCSWSALTTTSTTTRPFSDAFSSSSPREAEPCTIGVEPTRMSTIPLDCSTTDTSISFESSVIAWSR